MTVSSHSNKWNNRDDVLFLCQWLPLVDDIDVSTTATLYKSLADAAPEIKECVDACNFIAESTKQQNDVGSVCETFVSRILCIRFSLKAAVIHIKISC